MAARLPADSAEFHFKAGSYTQGELAVVAFRGTEALCRPFEFEIDLVSASAIDTRKLVAAEGQLTLAQPGGGSRWIHGVVSSIELLGERQERRRYRASLVPRLWKLSLIQRSRIFQKQSTKEIVTRVLDDGNVAHRWSVADLPKRDYCVQYRESDLAFLSRLLEFEGIFYFFEHQDGKHVMVLGDAKSSHSPILGDAKVPFRQRSGTVPDREFVYQLASTQQLGSSAAVLRDFDFTHPKLDLEAKAESSDGGDKLEVYEHPGGYQTPDPAKRLAQVRLEELRCETWTADGAGVCRRFSPGYSFELEESPEPALPSKLLLVAVEHQAGQVQALGAEAALASGVDGPYHNRFRCIPATTAFRPARRTHRSVLAGLQTAEVVGPAGEEIHTDGHGRIKVQFHWDRDGKRDDHSSCWLRVSQPWAGAGWGALYLPRVGQEVVVRFLEGDPDRPLVVGSVYNGTHAPPIGLPGGKTKSTLKSSSSKGGAGANELMFEDAKGSEQVMLHAQKDDLIRVENDKTQHVGANESLTVEKNRDRTIDANQFLTVQLDDEAEVGGNQSRNVAGARSTSVTGDHDETVGGSQSIKVGATQLLNVDGSEAELVGAARTVTIGAGYSVNVGAAAVELVGGLRSTQIGGLKFEKVELMRSEAIKKNRSAKMLGSSQFLIEGNALEGVGGDSTEKVGSNSMLESEKPTSLVSKKAEVKADELGVVVGDELRLMINKAGTVKLWGEKITFDAETKIKGSKVKLKPGGSGSGKSFQEVLDPSEASTLSEHDEKNPGDLKDADAAAFRGKKYKVKVLKKEVKVSRLCGGQAKPDGRWVTKGGRPPGLEGKIRMALKPEWGNEASSVATKVLKPGTIVYEGIASDQGGGFVGGATQILIR